MTTITFADVVHQSIAFSTAVPSQALALEILDNRWFQRLRDISQTANTRLVYMFSEHSRFGHCLGVAYLAESLLEKLSHQRPREVAEYRAAIVAAAMLHDIGHLAPGSHTAFKTWFPGQPDEHELMASKILRGDAELLSILRKYGADLPAAVEAILREDPALPPWTWQIISGGGWNVDRGNWCMVDSILAGVSYGEYNIPALTDSIVITDSGHLAVRENRLDAMMHFAVSRHAMYRQIYQHRAILAVDTLNVAIARRARDLAEEIPFADETMRAVLAAKTPDALTPAIVFAMRESWWKYHLSRWRSGTDAILADLSARLVDRQLFKTVRVRDDENPAELRERAAQAVVAAGYDLRYYLGELSTEDMHAGDSRQSMLILKDDGFIKPLTEADPLFKAMVSSSHAGDKTWLSLPKEAKERLGRER
jgi:HD superfamily phosphohydrolase